MKIEYARVSTTDQNLDRQIEALKKAGTKKSLKRKYPERVCQIGKNYRKLWDYWEKDVLIVESLDWLGRNYDDIVQMVQRLDRKEIGLIVLNLPILNHDLENPNLQKLIRNMVVQLLSWIAQNEREEIIRKQRQGIEIAKKKGHYKGRPMKYAANAKNLRDRMTYNVIVSKLKKSEPIKNIPEETDVTRDTVYRIKGELEELS